MAKEKQTKYASTMKDALNTFDLKEVKKWMNKYNHGLYLSFKNASQTVQMATMCKMICNRTDMLGTEAHKKAVRWLKEHNMRGQLF